MCEQYDLFQMAVEFRRGWWLVADLEALECDQSREVGRSWHKLVVCMQISAYLCVGFIM